MTAPTLDEMKFYIVVPAAATNYVTNPTPYRATTGYTAFDPDTAGTIAIAASDTYTRRGPKCIKITTLASHDAGVYFSSVTGAAGTAYTFSADVKTTDGEPMVIAISSDAAGTELAATSFTATGYWQRVEVSLAGTVGNAGTWYLHVYRDGASTNAYDIYTDGWQFEEASSATTFFSGDTKGFGKAPLEFYWGGTPHASISYRTADTRAGGSLLDLETYATVSKALGLGLGNFNQIYTELASGGAYYQKHIRKPRNFSLLLHYSGTDAGDLHDKRNSIIDAIRPDYTGYDQPLVVRYQGENSSGYEATVPLDIVCIPQPSHADPPDNSRLQMDELLSFTVFDSYLGGAYAEGAELGLYDSLTVGDYLIYQDSDGLYHDIDNSGTGIGGIVRALAKGNDGTIYIGGEFTNAGGVAEADYLCKWTGTAIDDVTGSADFNNNVYALCVDPGDNLYIGGDFTDAGDANGDGIVKWDGSSLSSLGTGCDNNGIHAIVIEPTTGDIYVGGDFTGIGGVANTARIAYWDGSAWNALDTGLTGIVRALVFAPNGDLYVGGDFTNADGSGNGNYIAYWDGSAFNMVGDTELTDVIYGLAFDKSGTLYAAGSDPTYAMARFVNNEWEYLSGNMTVAHSYMVYINDNDIYYHVNYDTSETSVPPIYGLAQYKNGSVIAVNVDLAVSEIVYDMVYSPETGDTFIGGNFNGTTISCDSKTVINNGNAKVFPTIEVQGPGVLQSITNYSTGKEIQFLGLTLQAGEIITIQPVSGQVLISSNWSGRGYMQKYINPGSDIGSFYLKPGTNYISLFMPSGTTAATQAFIFWTPKFWNIEGSRYE